MSEKINAMAELSALRYSSFPQIFGKMRELSEQYANMPMDMLISAFGNVLGRGYNWAGNDPYTQNRRVKSISTRASNYSKDQVADMVKNPEGNEQPLRAVQAALEYSAYPLFHTRTVSPDKTKARKSALRGT